MRVKVFKAGRYAGPQSYDPQIETESDNEVVEVNAQTAEYFLEHKNAEVVVEDPETDGVDSADGSDGDDTGKGKRGKAKRGKPPAEDKANAESG